VPIDRDAVVSLTGSLVRIPSVHDPTTGTTEAAVAALVEATMRDYGFDAVATEEVAPGRPNVIGVVEGGRPGPTLLFEGHTDVVTPGDPDLWSVDPFGADIVDGRLYGRGSADMKSGVAAMLGAARQMASERPFGGRLMVAALVDEEGMMAGARHFVTHHGREVDAAVCGEPEAGEVCNVSKGALRLRVHFHGRMAHGAMPQEGRNPNAALGRFLAALGGYEASLRRDVGVHPVLGEVSLTPTVLRAGDPVQMNVVPADASVWLDVRTVPGVEHAAVVARVSALAASAGEEDGVVGNVAVLDDRPAVETAADHPVVTAVRAAHEAVTGEVARLGGVPGTTDGTIITAVGGVPSVVYGPGGKWIAHQADEFVEIDDIVRSAHVYAEAARRFFANWPREHTPCGR
jgi:succinyl-diaminopimelate desuccinylase